MDARPGVKEEIGMKKILAVMFCLSLLGALGAAGAEDGLLRTAIKYDITTMDVAKTSDDYLIPMNVFDRLFETRLVNGNPSVEKSLCSDYTVSADGRTYDFTIREDVVFSNGSALTASDVQYTFERLLKINNQNTDIAVEVQGSEAVLKGEADTLSGFTVRDDTHFSVTLLEPNAGFPAELSSPAMSIVDRETMSAGFGTIPAETIGSGPYVVTEWTVNDHYTLEYNPRYRGPAPSVKKLIVSVVADDSVQNMKFLSGELDLLDLQNQDSAIVDATYKNDPKYASRIVSTRKVGMYFLVLNNTAGALADVRVRRAVAMAIDVDELIASLYSGDAIRETGAIPTGIWGHDGNLKPVAFDPEGARALLKEAGYGEGQIQFEIALDSSATSTVQNMCHAISSRLKAVGITAEVRTLEHAAWLEKRSTGEMQCFVARWGMDYNDPANILYTFFGTEEKTRQRSINYQNREILERVAKARAIVDDDARLKEYQALEDKLIGEDMAWVPLLQDMHLYCLGDRVEAFTPHWAGFSDFYAADVVLK